MSRLRVAILARTVLAALLLLLVPVTGAYAHGALKSSTPAANARLMEVPRELRLVFTEAPALAFSRIRLLDATGKTVFLSAVRTASDSRRTLVADITGPLDTGAYTVEWQIAGDDGHPVRGRIAFTIAGGAKVPAPAPVASGTPEIVQTHHDSLTMPMGPGFNAESPAYVAIRAVLFVGLLMSIGALAFSHVVLRLLRRSLDAETLRSCQYGAARIGLIGAITVATAALLRLWAQSYAMLSPQDSFDASALRSMLTSTVWGWGWLLQVVAAIVAIAGFRAMSRGLPGQMKTMGGVILLAFTPALSGHAASAPELTKLAILADGLHVIGAGGWLGSLLVVVLVGLPAALRRNEEERGTSVQKLFNAFSQTALVFALLLASTGVFSAWLHIGELSALWESSYGKTLFLKLALLSVVAGTGAYNWLRVKPALAAPSGIARMRKSARVELAVAVLVIIVTAVLVATPTPMDEASM